MDGLKKLLGWFLLGVAVLTLALLPFSYTAWPWNALGVLALGTGVLLVVAGSRLGQDTDSAASAAPVRGTPWWQQGLAFVAGLTVVSLPNFATVSGALLLSTNSAGSHQDQQLLTDPEALRAGVTAIRQAAGGTEISSLQVDHSGAVAVLPDGHGAARKFDYRRPGTLGGGGVRELPTPDNWSTDEWPTFTEADWDRIPEFVERTLDNARAVGGLGASSTERISLTLWPEDRARSRGIT